MRHVCGGQAFVVLFNCTFRTTYSRFSVLFPGKDKWLCPLSGKKFKGPDFVRKHIANKHGEKIEEVKKEVSW